MHPPLVIDGVREKERDGYYAQLLIICEHTGTHVDAPTHILSEMTDRSIAHFPADTLIAPAVVYDFADERLQLGDPITCDMIEAYEARHGVAVGEGEIALVSFDWMRRF